MPIFKDEERNTFYVKTYYTDYTGARKQKMKRGFKLQREAKEWEQDFLSKQSAQPSMPFRVLHDIRHSTASLLIDMGFSALLVSERLGHESVSTALNIYSHLFPSKQSDVTDKLQQLCKGNSYF